MQNLWEELKAMAQAPGAWLMALLKLENLAIDTARILILVLSLAFWYVVWRLVKRYLLVLPFVLLPWMALTQPIIPDWRLVTNQATIYVGKEGNNATARAYRPYRAFATIEEAAANAVSGDMIQVGNGTWGNLIVKSNVNWYLSPGATVQGIVTTNDILVNNGSYLINSACWQFVYGPGAIGSGGIWVSNSVNLAVDVAECAGNVMVSNMSSFSLKLAKPMLGQIKTCFLSTNCGDVFFDVPDMRNYVIFQGRQHAHWRGDLGGPTYTAPNTSSNWCGPARGYVAEGIRCLLNVELHGWGNVYALSDALSGRTNCFLDWHGNLRSANNSGLFLQQRSKAIVHGNVESEAMGKYWNLCGGGCGILSGVATNEATVFGNVRGAMPVVNEHGTVTIFGNVDYWNPYSLPITNLHYSVESEYDNLFWQPANTNEIYGSAIAQIGWGKTLVYGEVTPCATNGYAAYVGTNGYVIGGKLNGVIGALTPSAFSQGNVQNLVNGVSLYVTNNTPTAVLTNGSIALTTQGRMYLRTNNVWKGVMIGP